MPSEKRMKAPQNIPFLIALSMLSPGVFATPDDTARIHVGLCGQSPPNELEVARRIHSFQQSAGGAAATHEYFQAVGPIARLSSFKSSGGDVIRLEGRIDASTPEALIRRIRETPEIKFIEVNSFGGDAVAAMRVAHILETSQLSLRIAGFCMSACANYLLPAAREVSLINATIGFHGSPWACFQQSSLIDGVMQWGLSGYLTLWRVARLDEEYMSKYPRLKEIIIRSQHPDRGANDGNPRDWALVRPEDLSRYGIRLQASTNSATFDRLAAAPSDGLLGPVFVP